MKPDTGGVPCQYCDDTLVLGDHPCVCTDGPDDLDEHDPDVRAAHDDAEWERLKDRADIRRMMDEE